MNIREYLDFVITRVDKAFLKKAVAMVKEYVPEGKIKEIQELYQDERVGLFLVRNLVQDTNIIKVLEEKGLTKDKLPGREWDEFIIQIVEIAAGVRNQECLEVHN